MNPFSRSALIWAALAAVLIVPLAVAATSPQLAWRSPVYIVAGFAGVVGLACLLLQPLLVGGYLPIEGKIRARRAHKAVGSVLALAVLIHVVGLWITSPPDVIDALLFRSPTPFSAWGVTAMWAVFLSVLLVILRKRHRIRPVLWRNLHVLLGGVTVVGTIVHAVLIEGSMGTISKWLLCVAVLAATAMLVRDLFLGRKAR